MSNQFLARANGGIAALAEHFPAVFALEGWQPHKPLKIGINNDIATPESSRQKTSGRRCVFTCGARCTSALLPPAGHAVTLMASRAARLR
jgi:ProQ/FINO family